MAARSERRWRGWALLACLALFGICKFARAEDAPAPTVDEQLATINDNANILWTCVAAFLVFFMQAGFALVEAGLTRAKNTCNILMKNLMDFAVGSIAFWVLGFGLMFGLTTGYIGWEGFGFDPSTTLSTGKTLMAESGKTSGFCWTFLIFQTVFAATAATIVSGSMAERTKFTSYLVYSAVISAFVYPIFGHWAWGNLFFSSNETWLTKAGFIDFAGSTVVHSVGGWSALAGAIILGPRIGKFGKDGKPRPIPGHSMTLVALGVFILWLGWFGFNPGSTTAVGGDLARIAVTTNLSGAAGAVSALILSWILFKKPDTSMTFNGVLAGLVGITAGCANMTPLGAVVVGLICGVVVILSVLLFDMLKVDDPVGAVSVHGVCGALGTLMVGLWGVTYDGGLLDAEKNLGLFNGGGTTQLLAQAKGVGAAFLLVFPLMLVLFLVLKHTIGLRVSEREEMEGLDIHEHGNEAYPGDVVAATLGGGRPGAYAPAPHTAAPRLAEGGAD